MNASETLQEFFPLFVFHFDAISLGLTHRVLEIFCGSKGAWDEKLLRMRSGNSAREKKRIFFFFFVHMYRQLFANSLAGPMTDLKRKGRLQI